MFSYDSKFSKAVNQIIDCCFLSLLWLVSSLPLLTVGASTSALYHTVDRVFRRAEGSIWKEYWRSFRRDFKRATGLWVLMVLILGVLVANFYAAFTAGATRESVQIILQIGAVFLTALMGIWMQFWFPYVSRFDDPVKVILKNTLTIALAETKVAFRLLGLIVLVAALEWALAGYVPILTVFMPVAYISALNRILEPLFSRYLARQEETAQEKSPA